MNHVYVLNEDDTLLLSFQLLYWLGSSVLFCLFVLVIFLKVTHGHFRFERSQGSIRS